MSGETSDGKKFNNLPRALCRLLILGCMMVFASGCASIGHKTIDTDQYNYNLAINKALNEQMLLNLVQMRYGDSPMFLRISNVVNSYSIEAQLSAVGSFSLGGGDDNMATTPYLKYTDRPTITYVPLTGNQFAKSLLVPIPDSTILSFIDMGWNADYILRLCLRSMNGINNRRVAVDGNVRFDQQFIPLVKVFQRLQAADAISTWSSEVEGKTTRFMSFENRKNDPSVESDIDLVTHLLGIDPELSEYRIGFTPGGERHGEIKIYGRSLYEILVALGAEIHVPEMDVERHVVHATPDFKAFGEDEPGPLIEIHASYKKPAGAFIAVQYRGSWFWIDDSDFFSKKLFSVLMGLFMITESGTGDFAPILTIPAG